MADQSASGDECRSRTREYTRGQLKRLRTEKVRSFKEQFCCSCLLPIWTLYDEQKVHDQECGGACKNSLKDYGKMLLAMKKEGLLPQFKESIPGSTHAEAWNWLFNSRIPGILQLFGCIAPKE